MRVAKRAAIVAIPLVLVAGVVIYSVSRSESTARNRWRRTGDRSQSRAGSKRPTRVDFGRRRERTCTRVMSWQASPQWS